MKANKRLEPFSCVACGVVSETVGVWVESPAYKEAIAAACPACTARLKTDPEFLAATQKKVADEARMDLIPLVLELLSVPHDKAFSAALNLEKRGVIYADAPDEYEKELGLPTGAIARGEKQAIRLACLRAGMRNAG